MPWPKFISDKNRFERRRQALIVLGVSAAVLLFCAFIVLLLFLLQGHPSI